jgi:hypothetical protein
VGKSDQSPPAGAEVKNDGAILLLPHTSSWIVKRRDKFTFYLLGCDAMQSGRSSPTFRNSVIPQSSGSKNKPDNQQAINPLLPDYTASHPRR